MSFAIALFIVEVGYPKNVEVIWLSAFYEDLACAANGSPEDLLLIPSFTSTMHTRVLL